MYTHIIPTANLYVCVHMCTPMNISSVSFTNPLDISLGRQPLVSKRAWTLLPEFQVVRCKLFIYADVEVSFLTKYKPVTRLPYLKDLHQLWSHEVVMVFVCWFFPLLVTGEERDLSTVLETMFWIENLQTKGHTLSLSLKIQTELHNLHIKWFIMFPVTVK